MPCLSCRLRGQHGEVAKAEANASAAVRCIRAANFTRLLLAPCAPRFFSGPALLQFRMRSFPRCGFQFESARTPLNSGGAESHRACETAPGCRARDVLSQASLAWVQHRCHSSSTGASRKTVGRPDASSSAAFSFCTKAPPPKATILAPPARSSRSTCCRAACSARRNSDSPESRKISATVRPSRASMRSSRSSKTQFSRCPRTRPTLLFPGSHETNEENSVGRKTSNPDRQGFRPGTDDRLHRFSRSLRQKLAASCRLPRG